DAYPMQLMRAKPICVYVEEPPDGKTDVVDSQLTIRYGKEIRSDRVNRFQRSGSTVVIIWVRVGEASKDRRRRRRQAAQAWYSNRNRRLCFGPLSLSNNLHLATDIN